jgi:hypothetical protein
MRPLLARALTSAIRGDQEMSFAADGLYYSEIPETRPESMTESVHRPITGPLLFFLPVLITAASYVCGGVPVATDLGFALLTALCLIYLVGELRVFPERRGIGGILIYGGVLIWFCHDYFYNWFGIDFNASHVYGTPEIVAKAAFYHCLFIDIMLVVVNIPVFRWAEKFIVAVPEPANPSMYLMILLFVVVLGLSPFFLFLRQSPLTAFADIITLNGGELQWTTGRSVIGHAANLNYNWGGYIVLIVDIGEISGILCAAYAILIARTWVGKTLPWVVFFFWVAYVYPSLRRGDLAFIVLPVVGFFYFKYQMRASTYVRRLGWKTYLAAGIMAFGLFVVVQYESGLRSNGSINLFAARGNTMFSDGLKAWTIFPERTGGFFDDTFPGAGAILPIPHVIFTMLMDPIPRALWPGKPVDAFDVYFNILMSGERNGATGTTESSGAVGVWYFRYGPMGVVEGAIIYGWFMGLAERSLRRAGLKPFALIFSLAFATSMFRAYRNLWFHDLDPLLVAGILLYVLIKLTGAAPSQRDVAYNP